MGRLSAGAERQREVDAASRTVQKVQAAERRAAGASEELLQKKSISLRWDRWAGETVCTSGAGSRTARARPPRQQAASILAAAALAHNCLQNGRCRQAYEERQKARQRLGQLQSKLHAAEQAQAAEQQAAQEKRNAALQQLRTSTEKARQGIAARAATIK